MSGVWQRSVLAVLARAGAARRLMHRADRRVRAAGRRRAEFYDQAWQDAARAVGAEVRRLDGSIWEIRRGPQRTSVYLNYTSLDDPVTLRIAGHKGVVHTLVAEAGVPVPPHRAFDLRSLDAATRFLADAAAPCVVKPLRGGSAGQGVTTGIRNRRELLWAAATAGAYSDQLLVEAMLRGTNYRLLYLDGELLDVVRRDPPRVVGDGESSVRALVDRMNRERAAGGYAVAQTVLLLDRDLRHTLAADRLTVRSVPAAGRVVVLKAVVNDNASADNGEARAEVSDAIVAAGRRAAAAVGARLAGVDVITSNPHQDLKSGGGAVLEVNTTPGFHMHYFRRGEPCRVAEIALTRLLDPTRRGDAAASDVAERAQ